MKSFAVAAALLPLMALAMPAPMNDGKPYEEPKHEMSHGKEYLSNGPFDFTSTYAAYASPDQV